MKWHQQKPQEYILGIWLCVIQSDLCKKWSDTNKNLKNIYFEWHVIIYQVIYLRS